MKSKMFAVTLCLTVLTIGCQKSSDSREKALSEPYGTFIKTGSAKEKSTESCKNSSLLNPLLRVGQQYQLDVYALDSEGKVTQASDQKTITELSSNHLVYTQTASHSKGKTVAETRCESSRGGRMKCDTKTISGPDSGKFSSIMDDCELKAATGDFTITKDDGFYLFPNGIKVAAKRTIAKAKGQISCDIKKAGKKDGYGDVEYVYITSKAVPDMDLEDYDCSKENVIFVYDSYTLEGGKTLARRRGELQILKF